jgi:gliding motility-associated-like protein
LTIDNPFKQNPVVSPTANTLYYVTVSGINTCTNTDSVKVEVWPDPIFTINPSIAICLSDSTQLHASGGKSYLWQPNESLNNANIANPKASPTVTTIYSVLVTDNCNNSTKLSTTVMVSAIPKVEIIKSNDINCITTTAQLHATGGVKYYWSPNTNINNTNIQNPIVYPSSDTWYDVILSDENGCSKNDSVLVLASFSTEKENFYIPNAFTPNNDGKNDCFGLKHLGQVEFFSLSIYNRWGQVVFQTNNTSECWDGIFQGSRQPAGVFVYQIKVKSPCTNGLLYKKGLVTLIR